jgi:alpha-tubulin suppressor-like RCC1 family protein
MPTTGTITTNFIDESGADLGLQLIEKSYILDVYPYLNPVMITPLLYGVGENSAGELGDNTVVNKSNAIQTIAFGANWKQVFASASNLSGHSSSYGIKNDGTLWSWGNNTSGQLGDGTITHRSSPVQVIGTATTWSQVASNRSSAAGVKLDGTLWCWGSNTGSSSGALGDGTTVSKSSPVQTIAFGSTWKQCSVGANHTAAIKTDGTLWSWGFNAYGQLGDGTITHRSSPVQTTAFGTTWKQVSCGYKHTTAIKQDGTVWSWGLNTNGQLGDGTITHRSSPVQTTAFGTTWKIVSSSGLHTVAIKTDGTFWSWGQNANGQLGDGTLTHRSSPVQTTAFGINWKLCSGGYKTTAAIKTDGTLWSWGFNAYGQLGDGTITHRSSPVQTTAFGINWKQVSTGGLHTLMIQDANF